MSSTFVQMYHPLLPATADNPVWVALKSVDEHEAKGWLQVDPEAPSPPASTPYFSREAADSRFVQDAQLPAKMATVAAGNNAFTVAQRAAFVPFWKPSETVSAGTVRMTALGVTITRNSQGTTRPSFDATEAALWTVSSGAGGSGGSPVFLIDPWLKDVTQIPGVITAAADNSTAINDYIAGAPSGIRGLLIPAGVTINAAVRMTRPNWTLTGAGWDSTIRTPSGATSHINDAAVRILADGCVVENLQLDGNKAGNAALDDFNLGRWADGVGIYANRATVRNCRIKDAIGHKVIVWNESFDPTSTSKGARSEITIEGNHVTGSGQRASIDIASTDVTAGVSNNIIIRGNMIRDMLMIVHTGEDILIEGNVVIDVTQVASGISVHTNSKRVRVVNNIIGPCSVGLSTSNNCEDIAFVGNKIFNTLGTGILVEACTRAQADGNTVRTTGAGAPGISFRGVAGGTIRANNISGAGQHSIDLGLSTSDVLVDGNKSWNPGQYHVAQSTVSDITTRGNSFRGGVIGVAATTGTNTGLLIEGNDIKGTSANGIYTTAADTLVRGNTVRGAGAHAIRVQGQGTRVVANEVRDTTGTGINLAAAVTGVAITDNRIVNSSVAAIGGRQADTVVRRNVGYTTEAEGATSVADGATITHGLAAAPTVVTASGSVAGESVTVTAKSSTTFTVAIKTAAGAAGTTQTVYWRVSI